MATRGTPLFGDRAAVDTTNYASLHALDIRNLEFVVHVPQPTAQLNVPIADGDLHWEQRALTEADISDLDHTDADAIHDNVAGEIHAITEKASTADADELVIEDSADSWAKKRVTIANLLAGTEAVIPLFSQVADTDVENTTDATSVLGSGRGTKTIAANEIDQGSVIVIVGHGYLSTTGEPTLKISVTLGGSEVCATEVFTTADTITDQGFTFRAEIVCRSTGATGSVVAGGTFEYDAGNQHKLQKTSATAINTTGTLAVDVTATWGTASASNTLTCQAATIQLIKADKLAVAAPSGLTAVEV